MTDLTTAQPSNSIDLAAIEVELRPLSAEKLRSRFFECYHGAARFIAEAAVCVKLLKERGNSLDGIRYVGTYLRIASGQVLPEIVWRFIESPNRQRVERLPLDDQKRLAVNPMVPVVEPKPGGGYDKRLIDLTTAPPEVARLAVGPDGIRSPEEQLAHLGSQKIAQKARPASKANEVVIEDEPVSEPLSRSVTIRLAASELEVLRIHAAKADLSVPDMARRFLIRAGAFKD